MFTTKKILLGFIALLTFTLVIYGSYIYKKDEKAFFPPKVNYSIGSDLQLVEKNNVLTLEENSTQSGANVLYLDNLNRIFRVGEKYKINQNTIEIGKGIYIADFLSENPQQLIEGEGFRIKTNGPSRFYINTKGAQKNIFSFDNIIEIELLNPKTKEISNTVFLYPHESIRFNPILNPRLKGADLLRITQIASVSYLRKNLTNGQGKIGEEFKQIFLNSSEESKQIKDIFSYLYSENNKAIEQLNELRNASFFSLSGESYIRDYTFFLLNPEKKKIYYKNLVLRRLSDILNKQQTTDSDTESIIESLENVRKVSIDDYNSLRNTITEYAKNIFQTEIKNISKVLFFYHLISKIDTKDTVKSQKENINIENLQLRMNYINFDFFFGNNLYNGIKDFSKVHIKGEKTKEQKAFFMLYLNKIILAGFQNIKESNNINMEYILEIINDYTKISIDFYEAVNEKNIAKRDKIIETGVVVYNTIIQEMLLSIRNIYFKPELNENNLLQRSGEKTLEREKIERLKQNFNVLFSLYNKYKKSLSSLDVGISTNYTKNEKKFDSYFQALSDYDNYLVKNDEKTKEYIVNVTRNQENNLSVQNAIDFFTTFNHINIKNENILLRNRKYCQNMNEKNITNTKAYCYEITKLDVSGKNISFLLIPSEGNRMTNIKIEGKESKASYDLDNIRLNYEENTIKGRGEEDEDAEKYEFKNFFLYTFNPPKKINNDKGGALEEEITELNETPIIRTIKSTRLLSKNGEFSKVKNLLSVNYRDIIMTENVKTNSFDIEVKDTQLVIKSKEKEYFGTLTSKYIYNPRGNISDFQNPELQFINGHGNKRFIGNSIILLGNYPLITFKNDIIKFSNSIKHIKKITNLIYNTTYESEIEITYKKETNTVTLKSKSVTIEFRGIILNKIIYKGKNILTKPDKIDNVETYFNNLQE